MKLLRVLFFTLVSIAAFVPEISQSAELRLEPRQFESCKQLISASSSPSFVVFGLHHRIFPTLTGSGFSEAFLVKALPHVNQLKAIRNGYSAEVFGIRIVVNNARAEGKTTQEIAKLAHGLRRSIGEKYKSQTPENIRDEIYGRNVERYNDELGPSFQTLVVRSVQSGLSEEAAYLKIIESAQSPNRHLNELLDVLSTLSQEH